MQKATSKKETEKATPKKEVQKATSINGHPKSNFHKWTFKKQPPKRKLKKQLP
jgi:hypothetical protein